MEEGVLSPSTESSAPSAGRATVLLQGIGPLQLRRHLPTSLSPSIHILHPWLLLLTEDGHLMKFIHND